MIAGAAESTTGPPGGEVGRLDRILAEMKGRDQHALDLATAALADPPPWVALPIGETERLRAMVVALEQECAELTRLTDTCTCTPYPAGDGPEADCPVHGAVRAFNEATREVAALTDALGDPNVTHEFVPRRRNPRVCGAEKDEDSYCALPPAAAVHRTPARVRAELEGP